MAPRLGGGDLGTQLHEELFGESASTATESEQFSDGSAAARPRRARASRVSSPRHTKPVARSTTRPSTIPTPPPTPASPDPRRRAERPDVARLETSAESPVPVRVVAIRISEWIGRLGEIWVDGQIAQLTRRPGQSTQFLTLRDPDANISMSVTCARGILPESVGEGSRGSCCAPAPTSTSSAAR